MKTRLCLLFTLLLTVSLQLEARTRWFVIEAVLFKHDQLAGLQEEVWPEIVDQPDYSQSVPMDEYKQVSSSGKVMKNIAYAINRKEGMETVAHLAWIQPVASKPNAKPVKIHAGADFSGSYSASGDSNNSGLDGGTESMQPLWEVEGTITTYLGRYLHFNPDLVFRIPQEKADENGVFHTYLKEFKLKQSRKMRSRQLHYLDNPLMGMIVSIRPYN